MKLTLKELVPHLLAAPGDVTQEIFEYLSPVNREAVKKRLHRLGLLQALNFKGPHKRKHEGKRNDAVGRLHEDLIRTLFENSLVLKYMHRIHTVTGELDFLLQVLPLGADKVPMLKSSGDHLIIEAKCHKKSPKSTWIERLANVCNTHNARTGLFIAGCKPGKVASAVRNAIALNAVKQQPAVIVPLGMKHIAEVANGANFLRLMTGQYTLASAGASSSLQV